MIAKYAGTCPLCPAPVRPGDEVVKATVGGGARWVHAGCRDLAVTAPPAAPVDLLVPGALEVWTDGACLVNPGGPGGWAWAVGADHHASGSDPSTTNQRMEIRAAYEAARTFDGPLVVVSDSRYVVDCFTKTWWKGWLRNGWQNSAKKPVANRDLWEPFVELVADRGDEIAFRWVKGHAGHPLNELADQLAGAAARSVATSPPE